MTDTKKLNAWIVSKGLKRKYIANTLQISPGGLSKKLCGQRKFTQTEISAFREIGMTQREVMDIFLS